VSWRNRVQEISSISELVFEILEDSRGWPLSGSIIDSQGVSHSYSVHFGGDCHFAHRRGRDTSPTENRSQSRNGTPPPAISSEYGPPLWMSAFRPQGNMEFVLISEIDEERIGVSSRRPVIFPNSMIEIARQEGLALWRNKDELLFILCLPAEVADILLLHHDGELLIIPSVEPEEIEPVQRQSRIVRQTIRNQSFGRNVKNSYLNICLICGVDDPRLMIGAHIDPVNSPTSTDQVNNGLCLCAHCHILFDLHDIVVLPDLSLRYSNRILQMESNSAHHSLYVDNLPTELQIPLDSTSVPSPSMIAQRYEFFEIQI